MMKIEPPEHMTLREVLHHLMTESPEIGAQLRDPAALLALVRERARSLPADLLERMDAGSTWELVADLLARLPPIVDQLLEDRALELRAADAAQGWSTAPRELPQA